MIKFKNIILDLGGVVLDIDYNRTIEAFRKLGIIEAPILYSKSTQVDLFDELEKGNVTENDFYNSFREFTGCSIPDHDIKKAWNEILIDFRDENFRFLEELKMNHRLFLLSNTNLIHETAYREIITRHYGYYVFDDLFEKVYLSHRLHMRKPDPAIFKYVLDDSKLSIDESCYIDDSIQHIEAARKLGISAFLFKEVNLETFFRKLSVEV